MNCNYKKQGGYIALMATIIISLILLVMAVKSSSSGWTARFNVLGTELKEQASALAEGCGEQALASLLTNPSYGGNVDIMAGNGSCHIFPIQLNFPVAGLVTIKTQAVVKDSYANLDMAMNMNDIHFGSIPTAPTTGTIFVTTHVTNDSSGNKQANNFTMSVSANPSSTFDGSESGVIVTVQPGLYNVSGNIFSDYSISTGSGCSGNIMAGEIKFCTITYDDITTTLTVLANVVNNNGGTIQPKDIPLFIDGVAVTLGIPNVVNPSTHTVSATTPLSAVFSPPIIYAVSPWGYDCSASGSITMTLGQNKTCIINFDDPAPPAPSCADTVMVLDRTGSMNSDLGNEKIAANSLVDLYAGVLPPALPPELGVASFGGLDGSSASVPALGQLTTIYTNTKSAITSMMANTSSVGTNLAAAINSANNELNSSRHIAGKKKVIIIVSDGDPDKP